MIGMRSSYQTVSVHGDVGEVDSVVHHELDHQVEPSAVHVFHLSLLVNRRERRLLNPAPLFSVNSGSLDVVCGKVQLHLSVLGSFGREQPRERVEAERLRSIAGRSPGENVGRRKGSMAADLLLPLGRKPLQVERGWIGRRPGDDKRGLPAKLTGRRLGYINS
jgi:hypothetical protein